MQKLIERIRTDAIHVGGGIVKVDGFINHQVDALLMQQIGEQFAKRFAAAGVGDISKVITAEVSGILPALATAQNLGVPMIYARKQRSTAMTDDYFEAEALSRTRGNLVNLLISKRYLKSHDNILIIDDFLATGSTLHALIQIVAQGGARLCGIGCIIEKPGEGGREQLAELDVPIITLAKIGFADETFSVYE
jgi:xanthine phosphoribosyltransferase